jgi:cell division protease FtsH
MLNWWRRRTKAQKAEILIDVAVLLVAAIFLYTYYHPKTVEIPLSQAIELSKSNTFNDLEFNGDILTLTIAKDKTTSAVDVDGKKVRLVSEQAIITKTGDLTLKDLQDIGFVLPTTYKQTEPSSLSSFLASIISSLIFIGGMFLLFWFMMGGGMFGKTGERFKKDKNIVSFANIGGLEEVKDSLKEVVGFIKDRSFYDRVGAQIPRGLLLVGPPGVGKTLLARALATEAGVPFIYASGSEFQSSFVAATAMRVKALFKRAKKYPSCIVFIDEFDSLGHRRGFGATDLQRDERNTLNLLLSEMDGFKKESKVMVLAATNCVEVLDPAVLRPGRFDRKINVFLPTLKERIQILQIHAQGKPLSVDVSMENVAKQTTGFSGADLAALMNESAILTAKKHEPEITNQIIMETIDKVAVGEERKGLALTGEERKTVAYHESGHAVVASFISEADKVQRISILPHGQVGGLTRMAVDTEKVLISKTKAMSTITVLLGGRVSEELVMGDITSGAQNDIKQANTIAREMVAHFGMGKESGLIYDSSNETGVKELSSLAYEVIDSEINLILLKCQKDTKKILLGHREVLDRIANRLLEVETLNGDEIEKLVKYSAVM